MNEIILSLVPPALVLIVAGGVIYWMTSMFRRVDDNYQRKCWENLQRVNIEYERRKRK